MITPSLDLSNASSQPFSEQLEALSNEALYAALCTNRSLLDEGLEILTYRLKPIIISSSRGYLPVLSWDYSDALQEARILLWQLISLRRYKNNSAVPFHNFFAHCFSNRLNKLYRDFLLRNPAPAGSVMVGYSAHKPLVVGVVAFKAGYIEKYRAAQAARSRRLYDKKLAEQGRTRQPVLSDEEKVARRAAARQRATERALAWQRQNREAYNARRAEIRRQKAAGTFIDRRRKSVCSPV